MTTDKPKHTLSQEELGTLQIIGEAMEASGFPMKAETLHRIGERFYGSEEPASIRSLAEQASREGRSMFEAIHEHYGAPLPPTSALDVE